MREDDEFRYYAPLLRRIIILVAVITAIPVVLWTITAFVRTYVAPPKIPTFHQLAATASINAPAVSPSNAKAANPPQGAAEPVKPSEASSAIPATIEARATATDAGDAPVAPKGPFLGDRAPENDTAAPVVVAAKMPEAPTPAPPPKPAEMPAAPPPMAAAAAAAAPTLNVVVAAQPPAETSAPAADTMPAAAPLAGPIPLPRHRPRAFADASTSPMTQMAAAGPTRVPMPRPRPDAAGPGEPADTSSGGPLDFLQSLFH